VRDVFDPERSDRFLVEFDRKHSYALSLNAYFGFKGSLEALLGRPADLVEPSPYLKASIEGSCEAVFKG